MFHLLRYRQLMTLILGVVFAGLTLAGCSAQSQSTGAASLAQNGAHRLTAEEVRSLVGSGPFEYEFQIGMQYWGNVQYKAGGVATVEWHAGGREGYADGTWRIDGNRICLKWDASFDVPTVGTTGLDVCPALFQKSDGTYAAGSGRSTHVAIWRVRK